MKEKMICEGAKVCGSRCFAPSHVKHHDRNDYCSISCDVTGKEFTCIQHKEKPSETIAVLTNSTLDNVEYYNISSPAVRKTAAIKLDLDVCLKHKVADIRLIS